jgi:hypothetical protein
VVSALNSQSVCIGRSIPSSSLCYSSKLSMNSSKLYVTYAQLYNVDICGTDFSSKELQCTWSKRFTAVAVQCNNLTATLDSVHSCSVDAIRAVLDSSN